MCSEPRRWVLQKVLVDNPRLPRCRWHAYPEGFQAHEAEKRLPAIRIAMPHVGRRRWAKSLRVLLASLYLIIPQGVVGAGPDLGPRAASSDVRYSIDDPSGPSFEDAVKQQQRADGKRIRKEIETAFQAGQNSYVVPPGDYRFGKETWAGDGPICPLEFRGLKRVAASPFRIIADGATFWFELPPDQAPEAHFALGFVDCSNLSLQGATLDCDPRGCVEGRITQIDHGHNRIEIQATKDSFIPTAFNGKTEQRIIPFNADGTFCTALYWVQSRGPSRLAYSGIEPGTGAGRYWVTLPDDSVLLTVNRDAAWQRAYGAAGTLQVGDGLCLLYATTVAISVRGCEGMSFVGIRNHISKGGVRELGGGGGHLWKDCYFGPRPGTCHWQGGDGILTGCMERGCVYDGITMLHTTDDLLDIHGFWGYVEKAEGRTIVIQRDHQMPAEAGDELNFFDAQTGVPVGTAIVAFVEGNTLTLDRDASALANAIAENPKRQSPGWEIRNSVFKDCYQRLLVQGGDGGTLRNNHFIRVGSCVELFSSFFSGNEGGICREISILDNTFEDVAIHPDATTMRIGFQSLNHRARTPLLTAITVRGNRFIRAGRHAITMSLVADGEISDNVFVDPGTPRSLAGRDPGGAGPQPVQIVDSTNIRLRANQLISANPIPSAASTGSPLFNTSGTVGNLVCEP